MRGRRSRQVRSGYNAVDVGVDIAARITRGSLDRLGIQVGTRVVLAIKALAMRVF